MFVSIINDCADDNAKVRQELRAKVLFGELPSFIGLRSFSGLSAAGSLIDVLDTTGGEEGVVLVNVAPRHGKAKKWKNGTPFGFFYHQKTLICSTIDNETLSLIKRLGISDKVGVFDIEEVCNYQVANKKITPELGDKIINTQFRSFEFLPRVAKWIWEKENIPFVEEAIGDIIDGGYVWWVDNFGNCKTTLTKENVKIEKGKINLEIGEFNFYEMLRDVPNGETALIAGSSGLDGKRFLEIVTQGENTAQKLSLVVGSKIV
ncbi:MAG: SAM hydroxide adenosyltransferase [Candidatus Moraniibacteriota bacterium]